MKKLFLSLAVVATSTFAFAQQFGVKGGVNLSTISNSDQIADGVDSKSKVGFNAGVFANFPIAESFSIQPEVLYNSVGTKLTGDDEAGNEDALTLNLDYVSVPVMFQYNVMPQFYLEAGPQVGFLINSKLKYNDEEVELDDDQFSGVDFGVGLGAGYYFTDNIGITARYVAGFSDVVENNEGDAWKNNVFQAGVAFKF